MFSGSIYREKAVVYIAFIHSVDCVSIFREKAVVYITFVHSVECFCVQLEDSPVDEIGESLNLLVQVMSQF